MIPMISGISLVLELLFMATQTKSERDMEQVQDKRIPLPIATKCNKNAT